VGLLTAASSLQEEMSTKSEDLTSLTQDKDGLVEEKCALQNKLDQMLTTVNVLSNELDNSRQNVAFNNDQIVKQKMKYKNAKKDFMSKVATLDDELVL
jgi:hypothetical protein